MPLLDTPKGQSGRIDRNVLSSQNLAPSPTLNLTQPKPATKAAETLGYLDAFTQNTQAQAQQRQSVADDSMQTYLKAALSSDTESGMQDKAYQQSVDPLEKELNDINSQIMAEQHALRRRIEAIRKNEQGNFGGAVEDMVNEAETESLGRQADLAVIQMSKQGQYDSARAIADRAVAAMYEKQEKRNEALKFNYLENKDLFDKSEQRAFELMQGDRERELNFQKQMKLAEFNQKIDQENMRLQQKITQQNAAYSSSLSSSGSGATINGKPQTTTQSTIQGYADRTLQADKIISQVGSKFTGAGSLVGEKLPNILKGADRQQYEQAQRNFVNSVLRRESGAVISDEEFANARQQYFPQPGDGPEVVAQKAANRTSVINNLYQTSNVPRPIDAGTIIEDADGKQYQVGDDGETLIEL